MDIFTTVLTRVVSVPIKPERLRVKPLTKEAAINELTDDLDHLENHEHYVVLAKKDSDQKEHQENKKKHQSTSAVIADTIVDNTHDDTDNVITHKDELTHPKKSHDEPDEDITHLDIFV
jgi:GTPase involved in cell partitioning and DNA repair